MNPARSVTGQLIALGGALVLAIGLAFAPTGQAQGLEDFWDDPFKDLQADIEQARDEGKAGVFAFFEMDECPFCHRMKTQVFTDPAVQEYIEEHFVTVNIDIEGDVMMTAPDGEQIKEKDFAFKKYRVRATPVMIFFDTDGEPALRYTGPTQSPEEFRQLMAFFASGAHEEPGMNFFKYKKQQ
ncbi:thioredoxin family protein [Guyparkeria sp.]|uniref:thioredoxin family protein n=1 Tax=Guyparkeria sp. TaxID=2035736 RepID=UPI003970FF66